MSFRPYSSYGSAGPWLGERPAHWALGRFKQVFRERDERSADGTEELLSVSAYTGVSPRREIIDEGDHLSRAESLEGYKRCWRDDLVMNIMLAWNRGLGFARHEGIVSPAYCVFEVKDGSAPRYLDYLLRSDETIRYFKAFSAGVIDSRLRLYPDAFLSLSCALPPASEQLAIAAFLDRETAKIDALVEEQRRLIELLREKRQAVISHAVTKGLDPSAPMKDSGVEWLGEVPAHWQVRRVKHLARMESGHTPDRKVAAYWENCTIPWVSLHDTAYLKDHDYIEETAQLVNELGLANSSARLLPERAVVFSRDATIGRCAITTRAMAVSQHFIAWLCSDSVLPEFLLYCLRSMEHELQRFTFGATLKTIGMPDVRKLTVAVPPVREQHDVVNRIRASVARLDGLIAAAEEARSLLSERRAALISAAVTGKIDVRDAAPNAEAA